MRTHQHPSLVLSLRSLSPPTQSTLAAKNASWMEPRLVSIAAPVKKNRRQAAVTGRVE
jgi:hypothetical protein